MTLSIVGRCDRTGHLGIAITSSPMTVTSRCAFIAPGLGAAATQAATNPGLGPLALELLALGYSPEKVVAEVRESDSLIEIRQVGVLDRHGRSAAYTGTETGEHRGHICGRNFVALGNGLGGERVVADMAEAFAASAGERLEDRLMRALVAGRDAGGDKLGHWSSGIRVFGKNPYPRVDLRVEMHLALPGGTRDAVDELRRIYEAYRPMIDYYDDRPHQFKDVGEWDEWLAAHHPEHFARIVAARPPLYPDQAAE